MEMLSAAIGKRDALSITSVALTPFTGDIPARRVPSATSISFLNAYAKSLIVDAESNG